MIFARCRSSFLVPIRSYQTTGTNLARTMFGVWNTQLLLITGDLLGFSLTLKAFVKYTLQLLIQHLKSLWLSILRTAVRHRQNDNTMPVLFSKMLLLLFSVVLPLLAFCTTSEPPIYLYIYVYVCSAVSDVVYLNKAKGKFYPKFRWSAKTFENVYIMFTSA